jgi:hypothetical protein
MKLYTHCLYNLSTMDIENSRKMCIFCPTKFDHNYISKMEQIIKPHNRINTYVDPDEMNDFINVFIYSIYFLIIYEQFFR